MSQTTHSSDPSTTQQSTTNNPPTKPSWPIYLIVALSLIIGGVAYQYLSSQQALISGALFFCIAIWATSILPAYWPALGLFAFATSAQLAPNSVIFSGFESSTFWLLFSGMIFGAAIVHTGLNARATYFLTQILGNSYRGTIIKIAFFSMALAFLIPSSVGRIVLLVPIISSLADHLGYQHKSNGRTGMLLATAFGTFLPAFSILPANAPNMLLAGMAETLYGSTFSYGQYLILHFPVLGLGKLAALIITILWLFPDKDPEKMPLADNQTTAFSTIEKRLLLVLCVCFALWFTDTLHRISAGWVGLAAAIVCLWPRLGLTSKSCIDKDIQHSTLIFVAGIIGLSAIIAHSGLGDILVNYLTSVVHFSPDSPLTNLSLLTAISTCVAIVMNLAGVPAIMTPMAEHLANITGLSSHAVLMSQILAFSNVLLPYQSPPLITAIAISSLSISAVTKVCLTTFAFTTLILLPLNFIWWDLLNMF